MNRRPPGSTRMATPFTYPTPVLSPAAGYDLALHYRTSAAPMQALAGELEAAPGGSVLVLQADLAEFDRLTELVAQTVGRFGRLDALVNNASGFGPTPLGTVTPAQWRTEEHTSELQSLMRISYAD